MTNRDFVTRLATAVKAGGRLAVVVDRFVAALPEDLDAEQLATATRAARECAQMYYGVRA